MSAVPLRVAAYGFFGMGNIGNEGSLAALLAYLREAHPEMRLACFSAGVAEVQHQHGVQAFQLMTYKAPRGAATGPTLLRKAASRVWDLPRTFMLMKDVDVLVVPGTGALETKLVATPWGLPYWLLVAAVSCRLRGRPFGLVSVGAERAAHPVTRAFYRWTARLATYASYRDAESLAAVRSMGVRASDAAVFPDLAFSLPAPDGREQRPGHVVIGVMDYHISTDARSGDEVLRIYTLDMTRVVTALLRRGRTVTLVTGDRSDLPLAEDIAGRARASLGRTDEAGVTVSPADTMEELMTEMATAEVVVASRFHNVVSALKVGKPTISLGYADKSAHLLAEFGLGEFSQSIDRFDVDRLLSQIDEAPRAHAAAEQDVKERLSQLEMALDLQFRNLSRDLFAVARRGSPPRAPSWPAGVPR